ncbi:hypothetical protein HK102_007488, partial [Quaeritorhiza haematococci]
MTTQIDNMGGHQPLTIQTNLGGNYATANTISTTYDMTGQQQQYDSISGAVSAEAAAAAGIVEGQQQVSPEVEGTSTITVDYDPESPVESLDEDEPIDFALVYALHTFVANLEGQVCVLKGDSLELLDDTNSYWWLVKCIKTEEIGYIPAENVETPYERLARLNRQKNVRITSPSYPHLDPDHISPTYRRNQGPRRNVTFAEEPLVIYEDGEIDDGDDDGETPLSSPDLMSPSSGERSPSSTRKTASMSLGKSFFKVNVVARLLGRSKSSKDRDRDKSLDRNTIHGSIPSPTETDADAEPINVLRIFAGNVDLKATFKSVALTKSMTVTDLMEAALKRFRVPNALPHDYYI